MGSELSARGKALIESSPMPDYLHAHFDRLEDHYDAEANPNGYIGLCIAENKLVWDLLQPRLVAPRPTLSHQAICYDEMIGSFRFREQLSEFMGRTFLGREFDPTQIAVLAGTGSVLEILFHNIADPGDAVLVPTPSYAGFWADLETRDELHIVPVHTRRADGFTLTEELLDQAFESSERPVKALLYTNPDNPVYFLKVLIERQQKCGRFGINAINPIDEFRVVRGALEFTNLSEKYRFVEAATRYTVSWSSYDNERDERGSSSGPMTQSGTRLDLPDGDGDFVLAEIRSVNEDYPHWNTVVGVYLRLRGSSYEIVGIDRESPETSTFPMN